MAAGSDGQVPAETIRALARCVCAVKREDIPASAFAQAQWLLLDTVGCGLAGAGEGTVRAVADCLGGGDASCALIGRAQRATMLDAVLANGVAVRVHDLNDYFIGQSQGQPESGGHPSDNIPVALAVGGVRGSRGADILATIIVGYELYARLQHAMDRGGVWDGVTASGLIAPAIAGRLMGLDENRLAHALALGAMRAATPAIVRRGDMSAAKSIANALVAQAGVQAALLAERGLTGPLAILDDPRGLASLFASSDVDTLTAPITGDGAIFRAHVKTFPCVNTAQSLVKCALRLHAEMRGDIAAISQVEITMADYPVIRRQQEDLSRLVPHSREAADHSFLFLAAIALVDGKFGLAQFEGERWRDPYIVALMAKITLRRDAALNARAPEAYPCVVHVRLSDGRDFCTETLYPPGYATAGFDGTDIIKKFHSLNGSFYTQQTRDRIVDLCGGFHHSRSSAALDDAIAIEGNFA